MLHYTEFCISHMEVPNEVALCIYISGCKNKCPECHYPELQRPDYGELVSEYFEQILDLYHEYTTCVCFMGEGEESEDSRKELLSYVKECHKRGYRCCLYSGRDVELEEWMRTRQGSFEDITYLFWDE